MKTYFISMNRLVLRLFVISIFISCQSCQAGQSQAQKQQGEAKRQSSLALKTVSDKIDTTKALIGAKDKLIVYYFRSNARCPTCFKLESYTQSVVESDFSDVLKKGQMEWKSINVDEPGNEHFTNDYKLYTKSVIVSTVKDGKEASWKNLDKIWQLVHEEGKYREYIKTEVKACLEGKCL
jgi:hypothetical protein